MCAACAIAAASAATGFRSWMQTYGPSWLTPKLMKRLTIAAMCAAGLVSTVGISGSTPAPGHAHAAHASSTR